MPYVPVPKDLAKVKTKVALGLTKRQLICFSCAAAAGLPAYFGVRGVLGNSAAALLMIAAMMPFFLLAMYERDGMPLEKILKNILLCRRRPEKRPYRTENFYKTLSAKEDMDTYAKDKKGNRTGAKTKK
jgi:hypothetical protein